VSLRLELPPNLPFLHADEKRLRQIVFNLLSNAIKFTPEGGDVRVSAKEEADGLAIAIADTGIGMKAEDVPKALEHFGQIDSRLNRKYQGTGLGLPLSKRLVDLHGGSFAIETAEGVGTTVTITFPVERVLKEMCAA
jgi:signal transduction histidine kinase